MLKREHKRQFLNLMSLQINWLLCLQEIGNQWRGLIKFKYIYLVSKMTVKTSSIRGKWIVKIKHWDKNDFYFHILYVYTLFFSSPFYINDTSKYARNDLRESWAIGAYVNPMRGKRERRVDAVTGRCS